MAIADKGGSAGVLLRGKDGVTVLTKESGNFAFCFVKGKGIKITTS